MPEPTIKPYGEWKSPITADLVSSQTLGLQDLTISGDYLYWIEVRPGEEGRSVVVRAGPDGKREDLIPRNFNARTRVHEYGGAPYFLHGETIYFSNFEDQRVYRTDGENKPQPITPEGPYRFADGCSLGEGEEAIAVCEDHGSEGEPQNKIVSFALSGPKESQGSGINTLVSGADFYAYPRLNPDEDRLAWLCWDHPRMPWDGTELWVGELNEEGGVEGAEKIAGGEEESVYQPSWSPQGELYFVSDRTGWWNIYRWSGAEVEQVTDLEAEFGVPMWLLGLSNYDFISSGNLICSYKKEGRWSLAHLDPSRKELKEIELPYTHLRYVRASGDEVAFIAGSPDEPLSVIQMDMKTGERKTLRKSTDLEFDEGYLSEPRAVEFPSRHGARAHGFYYPPQNKDFEPPSETKPPLIVSSHGGPTSTTSDTFDPSVQFWTSRGYAYLDVNYGGSTGYGREYRERLKGNWGIVDVDDCVDGAKFLAEKGEVDEDRLLIQGGSAGGYTTLSVLTFKEQFRAGASYFGVSDLTQLAAHTHKFESRYLEQLIGPYPEREDLYRKRSPINNLDQLSQPLIFLQGLEDRVVPPEQAESMVEALREKGIPVAYVPFEGEQHGFRQAENRERALEAVLYFYSRVLGLEPADDLEAVEIDHEDRLP